MLPDFKKIIEIFECLSLDNKAYFTFQNHDNMTVCIQYEKKTTNRDWAIWYKTHESQSKQTLSSQHLLPVISAFKINQESFIKEIADTLLLQTAFADEFIRQITILLGKDAVQKSIFETQSFMEELSRSIEQIFPKDVLPAIKQQADRLRIIK